jgi:hypothetical protein
MSILSKEIYRFNAISTKISMAFFTKIEKINLKIQMESQKILITKAIPSKKIKDRGIIIPNLKTYNKTIRTETAHIAE